MGGHSGRRQGFFFTPISYAMAQYGLRIWLGENPPGIPSNTHLARRAGLTLATTMALARIALRALAEAEKAAARVNSRIPPKITPSEPAPVEADA